MRSGTPSLGDVSIRSRHGTWRDSRTSHDTQCGVTPSVTSDATFFNATVDISCATSCNVTQLLVAPRGLARPKGVGLVLKFYIKKG
jgi:hypothetical protein